MKDLEPSLIEAIKEKLENCRQGDYLREPFDFIFQTSLNHPLTKAGSQAASEGTPYAASPVMGFVILSQTCDIVASCERKPFLEICPVNRG